MTARTDRLRGEAVTGLVRWIARWFGPRLPVPSAPTDDPESDMRERAAQVCDQMVERLRRTRGIDFGRVQAAAWYRSSAATIRGLPLAGSKPSGGGR